MSFDAVLGRLHARHAPRVAAAVGQAPPASAPAVIVNHPPRSSWPLVLLGVAVAGVGVYLYQHAQDDARRLHELENELDHAEHHCSCEKTRAFPIRDNPPSWVADEALWERAKLAVRPYWDNYSEPWAVVASVYEQMGGRRAA